MVNDPGCLWELYFCYASCSRPEMRALGYFLLEQDGGWMLCTVHVRGVVRHSWRWDSACPQQEAGAFVSGVQSPSYSVFDVTKPPSTEVLLLLEQLLAPRMWVLSAGQVTLGDAGLSFPERMGVSDHHQALAADLCCVQNLHSCNVSAVLLNSGWYRWIWRWDCSGKWLRKEIPLSCLQGVWAPLWEVVWWELHPSQGRCTCQRRGEWD